MAIPSSEPVLASVGQGIVRLRLPMPFELRHVNVYLLEERDAWTLIDTGLQTDESRAALDRGLEEAGIEKRRIRRILVTHIHPDHVGLAAELQAATGAELVIHRLEVALMEPRYARAEDLVQEVAAWLTVNGVPREEAEFLKTASMAAREYVGVPQPDTLLEGAERLPLNGGPLLTVWTPGHSPGHCCFYWSERRLLFSGDHLLPTISPNIGLHPQSGADPLADYLASLRRVAQLPVEQVLPAHGDPFSDHAGRVAEIGRHHAARKDAIVELAVKPMTGWAIASRLFREVMARNVFQQRLALQETLAHCQSLAVEGRLIKLVEGARVRWQAA